MTVTTGTARPARAPRPRAIAPGVDPVDADIDLACRTLQLPTIREQHAEMAAAALREQASYTRFLADLLAAELAERLQRRKLRLVHEAGFARPKRLEDFDYTANPAISAQVIGTLAGPAWVRAGQPLVLLGDSGTGKSHLLIGVGTAIAEAGLKVRYSTCANLVNELVEAADEHHLSRTIARYGKVDLLCLDEFGYLELDPAGAKLLFQIFTEREERRAIAIASNAPFSEWKRTFTDPRLCAAIVDRLTFNGHIIETGSDSYRLASTRAKRGPR
jgi:DNA replication protein DnaC